MAIYVSQATYNAGTAAQQATWTVDPGITPRPGTPQVTVPASQVAAASYSPPPQTSSTLSESQKQQILFQQGLAYGSPNAPEYQQLFENAAPSPVAQPQFTVGTQSYQPTPYKPAEPITQPQTFSVQGASVFGGYSSVAGHEINFVAPAPLMSVEPSKSPYGYQAYQAPTSGKAEAQLFTPTAEYTVYTGEKNVAYEIDKAYASQLKAEQVALSAPGVVGGVRETGVLFTEQPRNMYQDIDYRFQGMLAQGQGIFAGTKPNESDTLGVLAWGGKVALLDYTSVELTKMGLGFTQAVKYGGVALRYGSPEASPYIALTQSITGTKPLLTTEQTNEYGAKFGEGVGATFTFPITLAALGYAQRLVSGVAVGAASNFVKLSVVSKVSASIASSVPFRVSTVGVVKSLTSAPVFFGTLSGISVASQTKSTTAGIGAALAVGGSIRGFEMIGESIISRNKMAKPEQAYKETPITLIEKNFYQTKSYKTPEEAAKFFKQSSASDFVAAVKEGTRYAAYASQGKVRMESVPIEGFPFPRVGELVRARGGGSGSGFSKMEFQIALAKLNGKEIPPMMTSAPVPGMEGLYPRVGEFVRNPAYTEFTRSSDFSAAFKVVANQKPSVGKYVQGKVGSTFNQWYEGVGEVAGFFTQKGVDFVSPKVSPVINKVASNPTVSKTVSGIENTASDFIVGAVNARFKLGAVSRLEFMNPPRMASPKTIPIVAASTIISSTMTTTKPSQTLQSAWDAQTTTTQVSGMTMAQEATKQSNTLSSQTATKQVSSQRETFRQLNSVEVKQASIYGIKTSSRQDISQSVMQSVRQSTAQSFTTNLKQDISLDTQQSLMQTTRQSTRQDLTTGLKQDLRQDIPTKTALLSGFLFPSDMGSDLFGKPGKRQKGRYQPSFIALQLGLKTTKAQGLRAEKTGFSVRGLIGKGGN